MQKDCTVCAVFLCHEIKKHSDILNLGGDNMPIYTAVTSFGFFYLVGLSIGLGTGITYSNRKNKGFRDNFNPQIESFQNYMVPDRKEHSNSQKNDD